MAIDANRINEILIKTKQQAGQRRTVKYDERQKRKLIRKLIRRERNEQA